MFLLAYWAWPYYKSNICVIIVIYRL